MKTFKLLFLLMVASSLLFISCSDDDDTGTNPVLDSNYMVKSTGSFWIQETYDIDEGERVEDSKRIDSIYIADMGTIEGKESYNHVLVRGNGGATSTYNFSETDDALYTRTNYILPSPELGLPLESIPLAWVTLVDKTKNSWTILNEITINGVEIELGGISGTLQDTKYRVEGKSNGKKTVTIAGESLEVLETQVITTIDGSVRVPAVPIPATISTTITTTLWFAEGKGILKTMTGDVIINTLLGQIPFSGSESETIRYSIK